MRPLWVALLLATLPGRPAFSQRQVDLTGKPDATVPEAFSQVAGLRELPRNRAIVTDQMERTVFVVDFGTGTRRPIGRQGDGPGEYRFPRAPLAGVADTTLLFDAVQRRLHQIAADGTFVGSTTPTGGALTAARGTDRRGRVYFETSSLDQDRGTFVDSVVVVRWNPVNGQSQALTKVWSGGRVILRRPEGAASLARSITPFPALDAWGVLPDGAVVIALHNPYRLTIVTTDGAVRVGDPIAVTPPPVSSADRASFREQASTRRSTALRLGGGSGPPGGGIQFRDEDFPERMPAFIAETLLITPEGEIWIGRGHSTGDRTWRYDIFDAQGRLVGAATLPTAAVVAGFGAGTVYLVRTDGDDLKYLERHRR
ncbi:MAG: hypothetical protein SGI84_10590 [Gemmatimonadota bacterium]|nr:hypothetical protein [Gemmatimonadota bacterium]